MSRLPIIPHMTATVSEEELDRVEQLAHSLLREQPNLAVSGDYRELVPERLEDAPTLHVDDLSDITIPASVRDVAFLEDRARLRAGAGDLVASCSGPTAGYERYCRDRLGLGAVTWLHPRPLHDPLSPASACWTDREVRRELVRTSRSADLLQVHPHMGCFAVWALALLLHHASRRPVKVLAPPPVLTRRVNDKIWFADATSRLLGSRFVLRTAAAGNFAALSQIVRLLAPRCRSFVVKLPDSVGGGGNVVFQAAPFRRSPLGDIRRRLRERMECIDWDGEMPVQVSNWESRVLLSLSSQLWIPPLAQGAPVVEGLFEQVLEGPEGAFVGSRPSASSSAVARSIIDKSWLIGRLFQRLGYLGRCSFDVLVVGEELDAARVRFVECNGRWGGTSVPMTLMNRLLGDYTRRAFETAEVGVPGLERVAFTEILEAFADELFDFETGRGSLVLYNAGALKTSGTICVLAMHADPAQAACAIAEQVPARLRDLAGAVR